MLKRQLPEAFISNLASIVPANRYDDILHSFSIQKPIAVRINTLKISQKILNDFFVEFGDYTEKVPWFSDAYILHPEIRDVLTRSSFVNDGYIYIQNLSSMIPPLVVEPKEQETILDLAASPGSKSSQMSALMNNKGKIVANDISSSRLLRLRANMRRLGVTNLETVHYPGEVLWKHFPEYFDKVLLDAPCSLEGQFNTNDPKTYKDWTTRKVKILSKIQKFLLRSAVSAVKTGGTVVYSTCTLEPSENEEVIDWILKKEHGKIVLEEIELAVPELSSGFTHYKDKKYDASLSRTKRIFPSVQMEGFFIAKLKKTESNIHHSYKKV